MYQLIDDEVLSIYLALNNVKYSAMNSARTIIIIVEY